MAYELKVIGFLVRIMNAAAIIRISSDKLRNFISARGGS